MAIELNGFDELISDLNNLGSIGNKIGKQAIEEGAKIVLEQQKKDAPRSGDDDHGADKLDITEIKRYAKSGTTIGRVGISKDNWEFTKGLYFNHYGFEHYKSGKMVDVHIGWMSESFKKCKDKASEVIMDIASKEIDKILK